MQFHKNWWKISSVTHANTTKKIQKYFLTKQITGAIATIPSAIFGSFFPVASTMRVIDAKAATVATASTNSSSEIWDVFLNFCTTFSSSIGLEVRPWEKWVSSFLYPSLFLFGFSSIDHSPLDSSFSFAPSTSNSWQPVTRIQENVNFDTRVTACLAPWQREFVHFSSG